MLFKICKFFQHQPMNCTRLYRGERGSAGKRRRERERQQRERAHARSRATGSDRQRARASPPMSRANVFERVRTRFLNICVVDLDALTILNAGHWASMALHVERSRNAACSSTVMSQGRTWSAPAAQQRTLVTSAWDGLCGCQWDKGHVARMRGLLGGLLGL